ncbi:putative serine/threonine-protein kinase CST [Rosa sericea]
MVIVGEFVGGAALGAAFGLLFDVVKKAVDKPSTFRSLFENIKFSLKFLKPMIEKIGEHNVELGLPDEEIKYIIREMEEGVKLVQKSSKISKWNCMKFYYTDQLIELDGSLKRLLDILIVQGLRDGKETLILARKHQDQLIESARDAKETLVLAQKNNDQLNESAKDGKETLVLARQNADQLIDSSRDGKETLDLARQNNVQLIESARDGKETLVLAKNIKRFLKRIECLVRCTYKGNSRYHSGSRVSKASRSSGRGRILETSNLRVYRFAELKDATQNFRQGEFGCGGFGSMYKGWMDEKTLAPSKVGTGMAVAVKTFYSESIESIKQWQLELNFLGRVSHPNLVKLLGYCCEKKEMFLVYEFIPNGSLHSHLFNSISVEEPLSWDIRLKIAIGAARGLNFLHSIQITHRDVKPSNILLDEDYNTKLSDFSLAKWGSADGELDVSTGVCGTIGYIDPEYLRTGHVCVKSDVYSFGVLLLEILTGLKSFNLSRSEEEFSLARWAIPLFSDETKSQTIMDEQIKGQYSSQEALQSAQLALKCLETDPESRPSMKEVMEQLENIQTLKGKPDQSELTTLQYSSNS